MNANPVRLMVLSVAIAMGVSGATNAKSHTAGRQSSVTVFNGPSSGRHHGSVISFATSRHHGSDRFASRDVAMFVSRYSGQSNAGSYAGGSGRSGGYIQCVTFARADSGIELSGNASAWWDNAAGVYQRGAKPEAGSVLNFRANGAMHMGHVAVVSQVKDTRTIDVNHANWGGPGAVRGGVSRDISVVDVSPNNDWSAVRVALGHSGDYGSIYPTYGFIYNRPDKGTMIAANETRAPIPALNPPPRDLRGAAAAEVSYDEVAEAPDASEPVYTRRRSSGRSHRHSAPSYTVVYRTVAYRSAPIHSDTRGGDARGSGSRHSGASHTVASHAAPTHAASGHHRSHGRA